VSKNNSPAAHQSLDLSEQEKRVISIMRETEYGEIKVIVQNGVPVRVDEIRKSFKI